ncbi:integrase, catalytic region, zinc finger, CCHC-type containing protein [Tanacetum coccineum]
MTTLVEFMIITGADNRPPLLEKSMYDSWKSRVELYMENRENGRMILNSFQNGPLVWPTIVQEDGTTKTNKYEELPGLPLDVYAIVNHHKVAKEIWDRVKLLMQGMKLSLQERERLAVLVFTQRDDPIACINKAMAFLLAVAALRVTVQQVQVRQGQSYAGTGYKGNPTSPEGNNAGGKARVVKCYNCKGEGHMARQYTQPKRTRNAVWFKDKAMLAEAHESG